MAYLISTGRLLSNFEFLFIILTEMQMMLDDASDLLRKTLEEHRRSQDELEAQREELKLREKELKQRQALNDSEKRRLNEQKEMVLCVLT